MTNATAPKNTTAYLLQAGLAFGIALVTMIVGEVRLPVDAWTRAFLALGTTFLVSSTITLSKCVRDQQETGSVVNRIDQARLDRLLAEFDPFHVTPLTPAPNQTQHQTQHPPMNPQVQHQTPNPQSMHQPNDASATYERV